MAFFLEERVGSYMQNRSGAQSLGPGQYDAPSSFAPKNNFKRKNVPAFNQSTKKDSVFTLGNYNPAPGQYTNNPSTFKGNYIAKQLAKESGEQGVFYVIENGNLQKKVQPYAADRVQRFVEMMPPPKVQVGPGSYELVKPLPLPPTMAGPIGGSLINRTGEIEPPIKQVKKKLLQTAHQFTKTVQSVPSIPTGNKMLLLSSEEEELNANTQDSPPMLINQEANVTTTAESQHSPQSNNHQQRLLAIENGGGTQDVMLHMPQAPGEERDVMDQFGIHRMSNPPLSSGGISTHIPSDPVKAVRMMNDGNGIVGISPNMAGELHHTLTMHSQSQKNVLGIGNHPDSALDQANSNQIGFDSFNNNRGAVGPSGNNQLEVYSDGQQQQQQEFQMNFGGQFQVSSPINHQQNEEQQPQQPLYIYSEAEILKQKFIEQQQTYIKQQQELSKNPAGLGPGAYEPNYKVTRKAGQVTDWGASKVPRIAPEKDVSPKKAQSLPGPGSYEVGAAGKIGSAAQKEVADIEKRKQANNFNQYKLLQYKLNVERFNYEEKKQKHVESKKEAEARIGPGAYINPKLHSEFKPENKPEYLQFFGSTEERFKNFPGMPQIPLGASTGSMPQAASGAGGLGFGDVKSDPTAVIPPGPGSYDPVKDVSGGHQVVRKVATAAFQSLRKDLLFSGNEIPGPGQYTTTNKAGTNAQGGMHALKNWQTTIGAFGSTEKRFANTHLQQISNSTNGGQQVAPQMNPGPGEYENNIGINGDSKYVTRRIRGKSVKVRKPDTTSVVFKSTTGRVIEEELKNNLKHQAAVVGQYETAITAIGKTSTQGGAPNNFLLMKNERLVAPFQSTVTRFRSQDADKTTNAQSRQVGIANGLHGLASVGQQALNSAYGSQNSFFSMPNQDNSHTSSHIKVQGATKTTSFGAQERFSDPQEQKNFRIGPKNVGPTSTTYHTYNSGFVQKKSFNLRFLSN